MSRIIFAQEATDFKASTEARFPLFELGCILVIASSLFSLLCNKSVEKNGILGLFSEKNFALLAFGPV